MGRCYGSLLSVVQSPAGLCALVWTQGFTHIPASLILSSDLHLPTAAGETIVIAWHHPCDHRGQYFTRAHAIFQWMTNLYTLTLSPSVCRAIFSPRLLPLPLLISPSLSLPLGEFHMSPLWCLTAKTECLLVDKPYMGISNNKKRNDIISWHSSVSDYACMSSIPCM